jgi:hypothetical protein
MITSNKHIQVQQYLGFVLVDNHFPWKMTLAVIDLCAVTQLAKRGPKNSRCNIMEIFNKKVLQPPYQSQRQIKSQCSIP